MHGVSRGITIAFSALFAGENDDLPRLQLRGGWQESRIGAVFNVFEGESQEHVSPQHRIDLSAGMEAP